MRGSSRPSEGGGAQCSTANGAARKAPQRSEVVEIGDHGDDAVRAQLRHFVGAAREADDTRAPASAASMRGAQGNITASDQQDPDHALRSAVATHDRAKDYRQ